MKKLMQPLNVTLLNPKPEQLRYMKEVTTLDVLEGPGGNFHEEGLFSTSIFGRIGDQARDVTFAYIDMRMPVLHPIVFKAIVRMREFYGKVISGQENAIFNERDGTLEKAPEGQGRTGFTFFMECWPKMQFKKGKSAIRNVQVDLFNKYRQESMIQYLLVLPAGLRDAEIEADGRLSLPEINDLYQGVLMQLRNLPQRINKNDDVTIYDRTRYACMLKFAEIYEYIEGLLSGKKGFIQSKWASRRVADGTRNVITSLDVQAADLDAPNRAKFNDAVVGLYQLSVAVRPRTLYYTRNGIVADIFNTNSNRVELTNKKTLKREWVDIDNDVLDRWTTEDGILDVIGELSVIEKRSYPVEVTPNHYLALVYVDDKNGFKVIRSIDELPDGFDKKFVRPITYFELVYISGLSMWNENVAFVTRYPIENVSSSIPSTVYLKTTENARLRYQFDDNWMLDTSTVALEYPEITPGVLGNYYDSLSTSPTRLGPLGGDFDGDTMSFNACFTEEAIAEAKRYFKTRAAYIRPTGGFSYDVGVDTLALTLHFITGEPA